MLDTPTAYKALLRLVESQIQHAAECHEDWTRSLGSLAVAEGIISYMATTLYEIATPGKDNHFWEHNSLRGSEMAAAFAENFRKNLPGTMWCRLYGNDELIAQTRALFIDVSFITRGVERYKNASPILFTVAPLDISSGPWHIEIWDLNDAGYPDKLLSFCEINAHQLIGDALGVITFEAGSILISGEVV